MISITFHKVKLIDNPNGSHRYYRFETTDKVKFNIDFTEFHYPPNGIAIEELIINRYNEARKVKEESERVLGMEGKSVRWPLENE